MTESTAPRDTRNENDVYAVLTELSALRGRGHTIELDEGKCYLSEFDAGGKPVRILGPTRNKAELCRVAEAFVAGMKARDAELATAKVAAPKAST